MLNNSNNIFIDDYNYYVKVLENDKNEILQKL